MSIIDRVKEYLLQQIKEYKKIVMTIMIFGMNI